MIVLLETPQTPFNALEKISSSRNDGWVDIEGCGEGGGEIEGEIEGCGEGGGEIEGEIEGTYDGDIDIFFVGTKLNVADGAVDDNVDGPSDGKRVNPVDGLILGASTKKYDGSYEAGTFGTNEGNVALLYDGENTFDGY